ncbi:MAG: 28S ribosomal protein S5, mitochondrial [Chrysothrix sp. TS-e1954]|nr:MAG: 28S ribosomal protein S5, mitochondrial [Chrysothrix sp. TS-e1954]
MERLRSGRPRLPSSHCLSCLSQNPTYLHHRPQPRSSPFHTTTPLPSQTAATPKPARTKPTHRSPYRSITQTELNRIKAARASIFRAYTPSEKAELAKRYDAGQLAAIEAGEAAINPDDLGAQWRIRGDHLNTVRDVDPYANTRILPTIDFSVDRINRAKHGDDYMERMAKGVGGANWVGHGMGPDDFFADTIADVLDPGMGGNPETDGKFNMTTAALSAGRQPDDLKPEDARNSLAEKWQRWEQNALPDEDRSKTQNEPDEVTHVDGKRIYTKSTSSPPPNPTDTPLPAPPPHFRAQPAASRGTNWLSSTVEAPSIPKLNDPSVRWGDENSLDPTAETDMAELRLKSLANHLGVSPKAVRDYSVTILQADYVANMTGLGKMYRWRVIAVAGNKDGMLGIGMGGSSDRSEASKIAGDKAIRNIVPIARYERRTIYGEQRAKVGAVDVILSPRAPGFGLRVSERVHAIAVAAGLSDLSARVNRSRNKMNTCFAVFEALRKQRDPEELARARGVKLVDVRRVYYNGLT